LVSGFKHNTFKISGFKLYQADLQTDNWMNRQMDRQAYRPTDKHT